MTYIERLNQTRKELSEAYNKETDRSRKREIGEMLIKVLTEARLRRVSFN